MDHSVSTPAVDLGTFEAESLAFTRRARRAAAQEPTLRSFALILARCESAATLLGWRRQITPEQKRLLDAAVLRLEQAAGQVAVRDSAPPVAAKRANLSPLFRLKGL